MRQYLDMVQHVLHEGSRKEGRNGGTLSVFNYGYQHDLKYGFPLLTTKRMFVRGIFKELVWYLSGKPHILDLQEAGIKFWDLWADDRGYVNSPYGLFWRNWGGSAENVVMSRVPSVDNGPFQYGPEPGIDQLQNIVDELKVNPNSRRLVLTAWDPVNAWSSNLPPCHDFVVFNVQGDGRLNAHLTQRSGDIALGIPFNLACYSALIHLIAHLTGLEPGVFAHTIVDAHIYGNHVKGLTEQLNREPRQLPQMAVHPLVDSLDVTSADFMVLGYDPHPGIEFEVSA